MKHVLIVAALCFATTSAAVAETVVPRAPSCTADATTKKLAGAAKTSFMKKCETDSTTACDAAAADKKLAGAAKTSFTKKCVKDSVGE